MRQNLTEIRGPITIVTGKSRRVTFVEVPNDISAMIDIAKVADLVAFCFSQNFMFCMLLLIPSSMLDSYKNCVCGILFLSCFVFV